MLRAKAARAKAEGVSGRTAGWATSDAVGALGSRHRAPQPTGPTRSTPAPRAPGGGGRHRPRPHPAEVPSQDVRAAGSASAAAAAVAERAARSPSSTTCSVNYNEPQVGRDAVSVLEKNGCAVSCPEQVCCGMPYLDGGDIAGGARATRGATSTRCCPLVEQGARRRRARSPRAPTSSRRSTRCSCPGADAEKVAARHLRHSSSTWSSRHSGRARSRRDFPGRGPGKVAYQMPCHLRAQNMGFKTRDVLQLIPGTKVTVVERCTAMDGTWGMKKEFYPDQPAATRARPPQEMEAAQPDTYATDCSLSALQIEDVRGAKPRASREPAARGLRPARRALGRHAQGRASPRSRTSSAYEKAREAMRARDHRAQEAPPGGRRRPNLTFLFENRETVLFQIQEMVRTERIVDDGEDPGGGRRLQRAGARTPGELSATLFIEIPELARMSQDEVRRDGEPLPGPRPGRRLARRWAATRVPARFEAGHSKEEKMAAVHYLRFAVPEAARAASGPRGGRAWSWSIRTTRRSGPGRGDAARPAEDLSTEPSDAGRAGIIEDMTADRRLVDAVVAIAGPRSRDRPRSPSCTRRWPRRAALERVRPAQERVGLGGGVELERPLVELDRLVELAAHLRLERLWNSSAACSSRSSAVIASIIAAGP